MKYGDSVILEHYDGKIFGKDTIVCKMEDNLYSHIPLRKSTLNLFKNEWPVAFTLHMANKIKNIPQNNNLVYKKYKIQDNLFFNVIYEFNNMFLGDFQNQWNCIEYETDNLNIPDVFKELPNKTFLIPVENMNETWTPINSKEVILPIEIASEMMDHEDFLIIKNLTKEFSHNLVVDESGVLRFEKKENKINDEEEVSFPEQLKERMSTGFSVSGFLDVFFNNFTTPFFYDADIDDDEGTGGELLPEQTILSIIKGELPPNYD